MKENGSRLLDKGKRVIEISMKEEMGLVRLAQLGNREALNSLLISYMPFMENRAIRYVSYGMDTEDMVQEGLIWLSNYVMKYNMEKSKSNFRIYVYKGLEDLFQRMTANNNLMSQNKFSKEISNNDEFIPKVVYLEDVIRKMDEEELSIERMDPVFDEVMFGCVYDYIDTLVKRGEISERQLKIIELYYWKQMSFTKIGKVMGCSRQAITYNYNKILKKLEDVVNHVPLPNVELVTVKKSPFNWNNVWKLLEQIPITDDMMEMLWLYFEDGLSYDEVALKCSVRVYHVKTTFDLLWKMIEESSIKADLIAMFDDSKTVRKGFTKRRMLENRQRKQMVK